jgi:protoheme IX farnesyltransferase
VREAVELEATERTPEQGILVAAGQKLSDYLVLSKARLSLLVLCSGLVGFWLASGSSPDLVRLSFFGAGALLVIAGANAFNEIAERYQDRLMERTARRPLPAGRMSVREAAVAASLMSAAGLAVLAWSTNLLTTALALLALVVYVFIYTPLKRVTHWNTFAGALSGAIPTLMGWAAVDNSLGQPAWILFGILFFWQFPHTWSIASTYREDYARVGYRVLPLVDRTGLRTRLQTILFCVALIAVSVLPTLTGVAGLLYLIGAIALGVVLLGYGVRFRDGRSRKPAIQLMAVTLVYMPVILMLLVLDKQGF